MNRAVLCDSGNNFTFKVTPSNLRCHLLKKGVTLKPLNPKDLAKTQNLVIAKAKGNMLNGSHIEAGNYL
jgi:hypothetical protein